MLGCREKIKLEKHKELERYRKLGSVKVFEDALRVKRKLEEYIWNNEIRVNTGK